MFCPCHSAIHYEVCCKPYHDGALPEDALQLMRSRYAAYALHLAKYIMKTTHPDNPSFSQKTAQWEKAILEFSKNTTFKDLTILEFIDGQTEAYVTFRATLFQSSRDVSFTEKSHFVKVGKAWLYESGEIYPDSTPSTL